MATYNDLISEAVEDYRRPRAISQADIAAVLGLDQSRVSARLSGAASWTLRDLEKLEAHYPDFAVVLPAMPISALAGGR